MNPEILIEKMKQAGFADAGICRFRSPGGAPPSKKAETLPETLKSILVGVHPYYCGDHERRNLSLYAVVPDYHDTLLSMLRRAAGELSALYPGHSFLPFADASPVFEVDAACRAGLGVRGKNNLLITPRFGSFVFIGEILTTLEPAIPDHPVQSCASCGKCAAACPTGALGGAFDREKCLSHLTQKKGELTPAEQAAIAESPLIWGCDTCQLACPMNRGKERSQYSEGLLWRLSGEDLEGLTSAAFREKYRDRAFSWRGPGVLKRNLEQKKNRPD